MADKFDPYREALVVETRTVWSSCGSALDAAEQQRIAAALHADPEPCGDLSYVRVPTGFCRQITVTQEDLDRLGARTTGGADA